jgi:hypothetical protein
MVTIPKKVFEMFSKMLVKKVPQIRLDVGGGYGKD